jgi:hypothetical protein
MRTPTILALTLAATLFACDADKNVDTGDEAGSETSDESSGGTTDEATDSDTTETETSTMGPEDSEGPPTPDDFRALCEQQSDRAACEAVPSENYLWEDQAMWCAWWIEVPVELVGDTCNFGELQARCVANAASEVGCLSPSDACGSAEGAWSFVEGGEVIIGRGEICTDSHPVCNVDARGTVNEGVPECACLCDPGFPL